MLFDLVDQYERAYETAAVGLSLSAAQACVLGRLRGPRGMGGLAKDLGCDASNITQIVGRLEALGLVMRQPDPHDGRARLVVRTSAGDAVSERFEDAFTFARAALSQLSRAEQDQLTSLIRKALTQTLGPSPRSGHVPTVGV